MYRRGAGRDHTLGVNVEASALQQDRGTGWLTAVDLPEEDLSQVAPWWAAMKRAFDVTSASVLLVAVVPLIICIAIAIKLDSPGPVFYRVRRVGHRGRVFWMLKFRKMYDGERGAPLTQADDPRLTRVGAVLTRARLDELPQLWDVLRGRMSIIGPRPEDPRFVDLHRARFARILAVRPGITGITQVAFAYEREILDVNDPVGDYVHRILPQKLELDTLYTRRSGLLLDLTVIWWTLVTLFVRHPIAVDRTTARMRVRRRPVTLHVDRLTIARSLGSAEEAA
jgi:lipopolysaccharide/colanic/teichoic acid biosynthesis glycosyltransferase